MLDPNATKDHRISANIDHDEAGYRNTKTKPNLRRFQNALRKSHWHPNSCLCTPKIDLREDQRNPKVGASSD